MTSTDGDGPRERGRTEATTARRIRLYCDHKRKKFIEIEPGLKIRLDQAYPESAVLTLIDERPAGV
jgi:hypothetical protein